MRRLTSSFVLGTLAASLATSGTGCSWLYMTRAPSPVPSPERPVECTTSRFAPIADSAYAVFAAAAGGAVLAGTSSCDQYCAGAFVAVSFAALLAASAVSGFHDASRCDDVRALNALCIKGDVASCRRLDGGWVPPSTLTPPTHP